jgi:hypothetical protein
MSAAVLKRVPDAAAYATGTDEARARAVAKGKARANTGKQSVSGQASACAPSPRPTQPNHSPTLSHSTLPVPPCDSANSATFPTTRVGFPALGRARHAGASRSVVNPCRRTNSSSLLAFTAADTPNDEQPQDCDDRQPPRSRVGEEQQDDQQDRNTPHEDGAPQALPRLRWRCLLHTHYSSSWLRLPCISICSGDLLPCMDLCATCGWPITPGRRRKPVLAPKPVGDPAPPTSVPAGGRRRPLGRFHGWHHRFRSASSSATFIAFSASAYP